MLVLSGILYAILFLWQFPHFMEIEWMYREDNDRAGYLVLPKGNVRVPFMILETLLLLLALIVYQHHAISDTARSDFLRRSGSSGNGIRVLDD